MEAAQPPPEAAGLHIRDRARRVSRRIFEIVHRTRTATVRTRRAVREQKQGAHETALLDTHGITCAVVRQAESVEGPVSSRGLPG
jgi:hypothetical protein